MIHTHVLDGGAPLYGRVSQTPNGRLELTQLPFRSIQEFVPTYDPEERVFVYGVFGGTPRYLSPLDPSQSLGENITRLLCDPDGPLHDEPETVLQMELNEVNTYFFGSGIDGQREPQSKRDRSGSRHREHQHVVLLRPAGNPPDHRETSSGTRRSGAQQADSIQDSRSRIPVLFPVSLRPRGSTNSTARTPTRISSNRNCPTSSAKRSNRSVTRRYRRSTQTTSSHRCQASGGTRARR